ncbi:MAG: hypothetical protein PHV30_00465 [Candidatus Margulisbacteria bacterium]|nr:hypothetical protein [Candidatus Margulisiibacteriota bacterium]
MNKILSINVKKGKPLSLIVPIESYAAIKNGSLTIIADRLNVTLPIIGTQLKKVLTISTNSDSIPQITTDIFQGVFINNVKKKEIIKLFQILNNPEKFKDKFLCVMSDFSSDFDWNTILDSEHYTPGIYMVINKYKAMISGNMQTSYTSYAYHNVKRGPLTGSLFVSQKDIQDKEPVFAGVFRIGDDKQVYIRALFNIDVE